METIIWILIIALSVIVEVYTRRFFAILLVPGSAIGILLDQLHQHLVIQITSVVLITAICLFLRIFFGKRSPKVKRLEDIVGEKCIVVEKIDNFAGCGLVRIGEMQWSARGCADDDIFEIGEELRVVAIEGVKLICKLP